MSRTELNKTLKFAKKPRKHYNFIMEQEQIPKAYEPKKYEDSIYQKWEESGFFNPDKLPGNRKIPFTIAMPPPNVTGILHLGHAFENALMDVEIRYQRMQGKKTLLLPGTDHAAVATQARVEDDLKKKGIKNPRLDLGRDELLKKIREYAENSKKVILSQIKKMGTSCDWSRLAYTFDEARSKAVNELFKMMYQDGLIYRGYRVVNWSVKGQSTCSDDELVYLEQETRVYTFKYAKDFPIPIATTRPETKLGDTAVAVNPQDERYQKYIGQEFTVDLGAQKPLKIKIIADTGVDPNYGTGAVGVTPAHSQTDYEIYLNNKDIGLIQVIGPDGKMTAQAGPAYQGLTTLAARENFVAWLKTSGLFIKEEEISHNVGTSDRFGDVVEALPMEQWFIDVNKKIAGRGKSLKDLMRDAVIAGHNGDKDKIVKIMPARFHDDYLRWIDNLRDWCISRQIWWGHRIPVWYKTGKSQVAVSKSPQDIYVGAEPPKGDDWIQDPDTLDTWFSSGAWTFSTLGWPIKTKDLKEFHPTSWMQMGYEILFFWLARMILMTTYALDDIPFKEVYIHGMLRDKEGKKFSKSLGNGLDPLAIINNFGTDALRLSLLKGVTPGNDLRFYEEKVEGARNFINKLWNISRYILMSASKEKLIVKPPKAKTLADKWILNKFNLVVEAATKEFDKYNFSAASEILHEFSWNDFADWYLEISKINPPAGGQKSNQSEGILLYILQELLKFWHPFCPFVTEVIWQELNPKELLMIQAWPKIEGKIENKAIKDFELIRKIITAIRNLRAEAKIAPAHKIKAVIVSAKEKLIKEQSAIIKNLARLESLEISKKKPAKSFSAIINNAEIYLPVSGMMEIAKEIARLQKEAGEIKTFIEHLEQKLENKRFMERAPKAIIESEREKLITNREKLEKIEQQLKTLK